jgi:soluble P-type ATPase
MPGRIAVVFDSAGTLLNMYRVAKELSTGQLLKDIESTAIVAKKPGRALVVLHAAPETILNCNPGMSLVKFINDYEISIDISCSSSPFTVDNVFEIIKKSNVEFSNVHEVIHEVLARCPDVYYLAAGIIVDSNDDSILYVLSTGGRVYTNTIETVRSLKERGVDTYIASGDSMRNLKQLASCVNIPVEKVFDIATTSEKESIVQNLKKIYDTVVMVGDGMNDILALKAADVGVMTMQQGDIRPEKLKNAADMVIKDIIEVVDIIDTF